MKLSNNNFIILNFYYFFMTYHDLFCKIRSELQIPFLNSCDIYSHLYPAWIQSGYSHHCDSDGVYDHSKSSWSHVHLEHKPQCHLPCQFSDG